MAFIMVKVTKSDSSESYVEQLSSQAHLGKSSIIYLLPHVLWDLSSLYNLD